jgi:hypothetical protein
MTMPTVLKNFEKTLSLESVPNIQKRGICEQPNTQKETYRKPPKHFFPQNLFFRAASHSAVKT